MKVLFIIDRVMHYHSSLFISLNCKLSENGHELHLFSGQDKSRVGRRGLDDCVIQNQFKYQFFEKKLKSYKIVIQRGVIKELIKIKPDVVIVPGHVGNITLWFLGIIKYILCFKYVTWQCGYEYNSNKTKSIITKLFLSKFDFHLAYHTNAEKYLKYHKVSAHRITIINNTINEGKEILINKRIAREALYEKHKIPLDSFIYLYVGAVLKEKKLSLVFEAFKELSHYPVALLIVGDGDYLTELIEKYQSEKVFFCGRVIDEVNLYFSAANVYVLPGTGGLGINQAMIHSLPVICGYADGSADDLVIHNYNGLRLNEYSIEEMNKYFMYMYENPEIIIEMGRNSRKIIDERYSFTNMINKVNMGILKSVQT